ncbi:hypothetical protein Q8F55_001288 [Vanrija albida]|uniref:Dystroglycan C-terminal domain-containing protein n=1 Tax=Vanrija albida TaxID=181172 RepID=A0ABR3QFP1_9TREE
MRAPPGVVYLEATGPNGARATSAPVTVTPGGDGCMPRPKKRPATTITVVAAVAGVVVALAVALLLWRCYRKRRARRCAQPRVDLNGGVEIAPLDARATTTERQGLMAAAGAPVQTHTRPAQPQLEEPDPDDVPPPYTPADTKGPLPPI